MKKQTLLLFLLPFSLLFGEPPSPAKTRVLIASHVYEKPAIIQEFLESLNRLEKDNLEIDYLFISDYIAYAQHSLLLFFAQKEGPCCLIVPATYPILNESINRYLKEYDNNELMSKSAAFKDYILQHAKKKGYDYLFLVNGNLLFHPRTLKQLIQDEKEIVSCVYWSKSTPDSPSLPQVWLTDEETRYEHALSEELTPEQRSERERAFNEKLKKPGLYEVGGLAGCSLISKSALNKEISFKRVKNISFFGDDPHFCLRAKAASLPLYVDTHFPAYPLLSEADLAGVADFKKSCEKKCDEAALNASSLQTIFSKVASDDPSLKKAIENFHFENYSICHIEDRDLYYIDNLPSDPIKSQLRHGAMWEREIFDLLKKYAKPLSVVVDLGGHIGTHTLSLSRFVGENGTVHVFEPQVKLFSELMINMHLNQRKNVIFHRNAVGNEKKWIEMNPSNLANEGSVAIGSGGDKAEMVTLDQFFLDNLSLVKIDVEGFEMEALQGAKETISRNKPVIILEISAGEEKRNQTLALLKEWGYETSDIGFANFLCLPKQNPL